MEFSSAQMATSIREPPSLHHLAKPDILFISPTIVTGDPSDEPFEADLFISSGIITQISPPNTLTAPKHARIVQAKGYWLTPGFIDMHAHSDLYLLTHPLHTPKISQGCTVRSSLTLVISHDWLPRIHLILYSILFRMLSAFNTDT